MQSWGPFGPPPKSWGNDPFSAGADPFGAPQPGKAKPQDPWASVPDPWAPVPGAPSVGPAPMRGGVGKGWFGRQPPAHGTAQPDPWGSYTAPPRVDPWGDPQPVPPAQRPGYVDPWGGPPVGPTPLPVPKRSALPAVLMGAAGIVVVLVLVAAGVFVVFKQQGESSASGPVSPTSEMPATDQPTFTPSPRTRTTSTSPTPTTLPIPTGPAALGQNRLYANFDAGLPKQPCSPAGWPSDAGSALAFYEGVMPCLEAAWKPVLTGADMGFHGATVLVPTGTVVSNPCGTETVGPGDTPAFYCSTNETLYMPLAGMPAERFGDKAIIYLSMFAHEFGHHVQSLTGTLAEEGQQSRAAGTESAAGLELSRRLELQAQCFSGMFVGSIVDSGGRFTGSDYQIALDDNSNRGDWNPNAPRDHGSVAHSGAWWDQGYRENKVGQCNTWLSPPEDVS